MREHTLDTEALERDGRRMMASTEGELFVQRPRTHIADDGAKVTTYEIVVETKHIAFSLPRTRVRRRFSEFVWLRDQLASAYPERTPPSLPGKTYLRSKFDPDVLEDRKTGLLDFLVRLLEEPMYLSDGIVHLFLQTDLPVSDIEECTEGRTGLSVEQTVLNHASQCAGRDNDSGIMTCCCDSEYHHHSPAVLQHYSSDADLSPFDIFSPTTSHPILTDSQGQRGHDLEGSRPPILSSTPLDVEICTNAGCDCGGERSPGLLSPAMSLGGSSSSESCSSGMDYSSSLDESDATRHKQKKKVTFSQEVTVAEILDNV